MKPISKRISVILLSTVICCVFCESTVIRQFSCTRLSGVSCGVNIVKKQYFLTVTFFCAFECTKSMRKVILDLKFSNCKAYAKLLADMMKNYLDSYDIWDTFDYIVPFVQVNFAF